MDAVDALRELRQFYHGFRRWNSEPFYWEGREDEPVSFEGTHVPGGIETQPIYVKEFKRRVIADMQANRRRRDDLLRALAVSGFKTPANWVALDPVRHWLWSAKRGSNGELVNRLWESAIDSQALDRAIAEMDVAIMELEAGRVEGGQKHADDKWPRQVEVARNLGFGKGKKIERWRVAKLIESGELRTNGKAGRQCRIDPASVLEYCRAKGVAYNEE